AGHRRWRGLRGWRQRRHRLRRRGRLWNGRLLREGDGQAGGQRQGEEKGCSHAEVAWSTMAAGDAAPGECKADTLAVTIPIVTVAPGMIQFSITMGVAGKPRSRSRAFASSTSLPANGPACTR